MNHDAYVTTTPAPVQFHTDGNLSRMLPQSHLLDEKGDNDVLIAGAVNKFPDSCLRAEETPEYLS